MINDKFSGPSLDLYDCSYNNGMAISITAFIKWTIFFTVMAQGHNEK